MRGTYDERSHMKIRLLLWRSVVLACAVMALAYFAKQYRPGMMLEFLKQGSTLEGFILFLFVLMFVVPLFERIGLPGIFALMLAGIVFGPSGLNLFKHEAPVASALADMGRLFLFLLAGLEINIEDFRKKLVQSLSFGLATFVIPLAAGTAVARAFDYGWNSAVLIGSLLASHTILALPIISRLGLGQSGFVLITLGATMFTDIAALLVLGLCVAIHETGFSTSILLGELGQLAIYCVIVMGGIPWLGSYFLRRRNDEVKNGLFVLLAVLICSVGAKLIDLEDIVGAFLCGLALNRFVRVTKLLGSVEFLGKVLFIPCFFIIIGYRIHPPQFLNIIRSGPGLIVALTAGLLLAKFAAALIPKALFRYQWTDTLAMWSLSLPQLAATLAAATVAYQTVNAAGERLIDESIMSSVIVIMVVTSMLGPFLTEQFARKVVPPQNKA